MTSQMDLKIARERKLSLVFQKAQAFADAWQKWESTPDCMPDPETIEAACDLCAALGVDPFALAKIGGAR